MSTFNSTQLLEANEKAIKYLSQKDKRLGEYIKSVGKIKIKLETNIFKCIVDQIIGQMLSINVKNNILKRFNNLVANDISPEKIITLDIGVICSCGISKKKAFFIQNLANLCFNNDISLNQLYGLNTFDAINYLKTIKGIGEWTAEMVALFSLGKQDIFSFNDVALKRGILKVHTEFETLTIEQLTTLKNTYDPYSSIASLYYYHANDNVTR